MRDCVAGAVRVLGADSMTLLGTRYVMEQEFYSAHLERAGITVVTPSPAQIDELHAIVYDELTRGIVRDESRRRFVAIADDCRSRGGDVIGLCCTEFGMLVKEADAPWPAVDSTVAHVRALLEF